MSFRYFLYISDSKVEMLLAQTGTAPRRKRTTELSVKAPILGGSWKSEGEDTDRIGRLERVVEFLRDRDGLGTIDEPAPFFGGLLPMRWGPLVGRDGRSLVYFGGRDGATIVGLGGSRVHLVGPATAADAGTDPAVPRSVLPSLLDGLRSSTLGDAVEDEGEGDDEDDADALERADRAALGEVQRCHEALSGPACTVEFVAKRLLSGPAPHPGASTVLLGTPLYVALVD